MALQRLTTTRLLATLRVRAYTTHAPTVFDKMIQVNVTDLIGRRHLIRGKEGDLLIDLLVQHEDELGGDAVLGLSPEGRGQREAHVTVPNEFLTAIPPPKGDDINAINDITPVHTANSRLASKIRLTKDFNNLSVALGRLQPWRTL